MANPELRRDSTETDWVRHLQELLEANLRNSGVQLSAVDGLFGPITEASVIYFQEQNGLPADGIVGDATWTALEAASPSTPSPGGTPTPGVPTTLRMRPLDLTTPWWLQVHWPETTLNQLTLDLGNFSVHSTPNTQFRFLTPVGKLFGAGGIEVLHREVQSWPNWFVDWSTKATIDFSKSAGLQIGDTNHLTFGVRPLRGVTLTAEGNLDLKWRPTDGTGSITPSGGVFLKLDILKLLPAP
jgi:Putative peptidoglycan binding domain